MPGRPLDFITVTCADGRECPIHPSDLTDAGASQLIIRPGDVVALPLTSNVRRRITAGDLIPVDRAGRPVDDISKARAPARAIVSRSEPDAVTVELDPPPLTEAPARGKTESVTPRFDTTDTPKER